MNGHQRTTYRLTIVTLRDSSGREQTIHTTAEHPTYVLGKGWIAAGQLKPGDTLAEPGGGVTTVTHVRREDHPEGLVVYNFRVAESHTYFVRAEGSDAEPVWVHNNACGDADPASLEQGHQYSDRAVQLWETLGEYRFHATVAVSEVEGVEIVSLFARLGEGPHQIPKRVVDEFLRGVEESGGIAITSGSVHAEVALYRVYPDAPAIGINNYNGPCPRCDAYFHDVGFRNLVWPDKI